MIDGAKLTSSSSLAHLKAGCANFGLSQRGSKLDCFRRLVERAQNQKLIAAHAAEVKLQGEVRRQPIEQKKPQKPSHTELERHALTHEPFADWCELCVAHRSKQDKHSPQEHLQKSHSTISFDFGYSSRVTDEKLTILFMRDQATKLMHALPTMQKGGQATKYLVTEMVRFIVFTGHQEVGLRCDCEPSTTNLMDAVQRTCKNMGIKVTQEPTAVGDYQSNGAAEITVQVIRNKANILVSQIQQALCLKKPWFPATHPIYAWAFTHAAWIHNHFSVNQARTPFERSSLSSNSVYSGKVAGFGEEVLAYVKSEKKGEAKWIKAIYDAKRGAHSWHSRWYLNLKIHQENCCPWNRAAIEELKYAPWHHGLAALGHRVFRQKRVHFPQQAPVGQLPGLVLPEDKGIEYDPTSAAPPTPDPLMQAPSSPPVPPFGVHGFQAPSTPDYAPMEDTREHVHDEPEGEASAKKPKTADDSPEICSPKKKQKVEDVGKVMALKHNLEEFHEDNPVYFDFTNDELDYMEEYEYNMENDDDDPLDIDEAIKTLTYPYSVEEPQLSEEELQQLDSLADAVEIARLKTLGVLHDGAGGEFACAVSDDNVEYKMLSAKFVRAWRDKQDKNGQKSWLRRSRFVAREFAWLSPERQDLFSPASSVSSKLLPVLYLKHRANGFVMMSIDFKDAFLTVDQRQRFFTP